VLFLVSVAIIVVVSYSTSPPDYDKIKGLTYAFVNKKEVRKSWNLWDVLATIGVLALVLGIYLYFSFWI